MSWRFSRRVIAACAVALVAAVLISYISDHSIGERALTESAPTPEILARGAYLARLGDCAACHTVKGQPEFSGGLHMNTPIGAIYSTNITPEPTHGIGRFSLTDFDRALRFGVSRGRTLYPAMPFTSYSNTKPQDVAALYAYFTHSVAPAAVPNRRQEIPFPLSMRWPLTYWRWFFAPSPKPFFSPVGSDASLAAGAYFVEGLGHCGECHTPRGWAMQLKALNSNDGPEYLSGAVIDNYFAPSLRSEGAGSLADWNEAALAQFLTTGANATGIAFASMNDVIVHSTQYLTASDAAAAAHYLKSFKSQDSATHRQFVYDDSTHRALMRGDASKPGALVYLNNCAACHRPDGIGYERVFPGLAGNPVVQAPTAASVVGIVLRGSRTPRTPGALAQFAMPSFAWRLSDNEIAEVASFIRDSWGNEAPTVSAEEVRRLRGELHADATGRNQGAQ